MYTQDYLASSGRACFVILRLRCLPSWFNQGYICLASCVVRIHFAALRGLRRSELGVFVDGVHLEKGNNKFFRGVMGAVIKFLPSHYFGFVGGDKVLSVGGMFPPPHSIVCIIT